MKSQSNFIKVHTNHTHRALSHFRKKFSTKQPSFTHPTISYVVCSLKPLPMTLVLDTTQCVVTAHQDFLTT